MLDNHVRSDEVETRVAKREPTDIREAAVADGAMSLDCGEVRVDAHNEPRMLDKFCLRLCAPLGKNAVTASKIEPTRGRANVRAEALLKDGL
jgi:hypothetical protein